ncbi:MAG: phosphoribosylanthranilate isomerase [Acutalibacteraceae bacterium]
MTKIKLCGLTRPCDIENANTLGADYIGFVFAEKSRRYICPENAAGLKALLRPEIAAVGVFVNEEISRVAETANCGIIDWIQLHGQEDESYIHALRKLTDRLILQAFSIRTNDDILAAERSSADFVLLDSPGGGTGRAFDWTLLKNVKRDYFLAGGLGAGNVGEAVRTLRPFAVDVSSGIETDGLKDQKKMADFVSAVRKENES